MAKKTGVNKQITRKVKSTITISVDINELKMECSLGLNGTEITVGEFVKVLLTSIQAVRQQFSDYCFKNKITDKGKFNRLYDTLIIKELIELK